MAPPPTHDEASALAFLQAAERLMKQMRNTLKTRRTDAASGRELSVLDQRIDQVSCRKRAVRAHLVTGRRN